MSIPLADDKVIGNEIVQLSRFDPESEMQIKELVRQRVLAGWNVTEARSLWPQMQRKGEKNIYWIWPVNQSAFDPSSTDVANLAVNSPLQPPNMAFRPVGHISLDWFDDSGDKRLVDKSEHRATINSFFLLVQLHGKGFGKATMQVVEDLAKSQAFGCTELTLNCIPADVITNPEWWKDTYGTSFEPGMEKRTVNQFFYAKLGYTAFDRKPKHPYKSFTGRSIMLEAIYMRKSLI